MLDLQTKIKRQIEILGIAIDNPGHLKDTDLAALFERDIPTIKRDLQELRKHGIDIHSERRKGVCLASPIDPSELQELIIQYMGLCNAAAGVDRATSLMIHSQKERALSNLVTLQQCIERHRIAYIDYQKDAQQVETRREISPLLIFSSEAYWRVLAVNDGCVKQYHLNKLLSVKASDRTFTPPPQEQIDTMFRYSFKSWVGTEQHHITIKLSKVWAARLKPRQMMETQVISEFEDGSMVFETTVNSLDEVASWVVSRGAGVWVVGPEELKTKVIALARGVIANYD